MDASVAAGVVAAAIAAALVFASWEEVRVHLEAIFPAQAPPGPAQGLSSSGASFHEGELQRQVGCQHCRIGSVAVDLLDAVHSWVAEAKVEHQVSHCALEEGLVAQTSEWGFDRPKSRCWPQEFEGAAAVAVAHVSPVRGALPEEVAVPKNFIRVIH